MIAFPDVFDVVADGGYAARRLVAEYLSRLWFDPEPVPVALPAVPVRPADTAGFQFDHHSFR